MNLTITESFPPARQARSMASNKHWALRAFTSSRSQSSLQFSLGQILLRPLLLLSEPLVCLTDLFSCTNTSFSSSTSTFILSFSKVSSTCLKPDSDLIRHIGIYNMQDGTSALMFLPVACSAIIAILIFLWWDRYQAAAKQRGKAWSKVEENRRLPLACLGGPLFAISEFWLVRKSRTGRGMNANSL